jgi:hypothetical protein
MTGECADNRAPGGTTETAPKGFVATIIVARSSRISDACSDTTTYQCANSGSDTGALSPIAIGWHRASRGR